METMDPRKVYDLGTLTGVNAWKYWLIAGIVCFVFAILNTRSALDKLPPPKTEEWEFEENDYSIIWGLFLAVITITLYAGVVDLDDETQGQFNIIITVQLGINLFWTFSMDAESPSGLFYTQLLLAVTVLWMMKLFWNVSTFGFWICVLYLISILFETARIYRKAFRN